MPDSRHPGPFSVRNRASPPASIRVPLVLLAVALGGMAVAVTTPALSDLLLVAGPAALASLWLLIIAAMRRRGAAPAWIVVDGSNVMHWKEGVPDLDTLREVLGRLSNLGLAPGVVFDANAGYLVAGRYQHDQAFARSLGLPESRVMVVPKGTPADDFILTSARDLGARIVTNDRYRDWADRHPEVREPGRLIRGGYRDGALWLDLDEGRADIPQDRAISPVPIPAPRG